jgi:sugar phosphate isomerase/epimerase
VTTDSAVLLSIIQYHDALNAGTMTLVDLVDTAQRLGAGGVEFRPDYWRDKAAEIATVRQATTERGLRAIYATMATLFTADAAGEEQLRQDVDDAVALGSPLLRVFQGAAPERDDDPAWDRARQAVEYAAGQGLVLALENFARAPGCRAAEIGRVLDTIPHPALVTNVDIGNYAANDEDVPAAIRAFGPRVAMSHLKDVVGGEATYLGGGSLPLPAILDAFAALSQPIIHCFEFGGGDDPDGRIAASLAYLKARGK